MKKLVSAVLALSLLSATAASAQSYRGRDTYSQSYHRSGNNGALVGLGIGLFALAAIAASQHHDRDSYAYDRNYDERDRYNRSYGYPSYGYGQSYGYNQSYGYDRSYNGYGGYNGRYGYGR